LFAADDGEVRVQKYLILSHGRRVPMTSRTTQATIVSKSRLHDMQVSKSTASSASLAPSLLLSAAHIVSTTTIFDGRSRRR
jgi:hypothetical protein